jgi:chromosome segregation ATPase
MHRELNPHLFGSKSGGDKPAASTPGPFDPLLPSQTSSGMPKIPNSIPPEVKQLETQVQALKLQLQSSEKRSEVLIAQLQELSRSTTSRFERVSQALTRLESSAAQQFQEINSKYAGLASKVNERKVQDAKIQEMLDRHNLIVRNFENRLTHLQRVISEQEMHLLNASAALEDARQEIARLKRGS